MRLFGLLLKWMDIAIVIQCSFTVTSDIYLTLPYVCLFFLALDEYFIVILFYKLQFIIFASALCCTAFAYPGYDLYDGHDLTGHSGGYEVGDYHQVASQRIGGHELIHEDEHVDYYVSIATIM